MALIALLAGLPGVGKSTLAIPLAKAIAASVIDRDQIKQSIIPAAFLTHSRLQVNLATLVCAQICETVVAESTQAKLIIDGHTFSRRHDVDRYREIVHDHPVARLVIVHCVASEAVVADRIAHDAEGLRKGRTWQKYIAVRNRFEPLDDRSTPIIRVDLTDSLESALNYVVQNLDVAGNAYDK